MIKDIITTKYGDLEGKAWNEVFQTDIRVSISSENKLPYAKKCAEYFSNMSEEMVERLCKYCIRYCEEMRELIGEDEVEVPANIKGKEILSYIEPSVLIIDEACDESIIEFHVECECDWEEEHGLEITIKDNKIIYVGSYDGMPPHQMSRIEYAGYYNENSEMNMNYVDKE